jgi:glycosyltransferase involved in cell wall biosynthesis
LIKIKESLFIHISSWFIFLPGKFAANFCTERQDMKLAVIIPCFNEEKTIADVIKGIPSRISGFDEKEVMVIDDGSSDKTRERAEEAGARVVSHNRNRGLGATYRTGLLAAIDSNADVIVNIDGDGQFNPGDIPLLLDPILKNEADMTTASRFCDPGKIPEMPGIKLWGNRFMAQLVYLMTGERFHDVSCGFRAVTRKVAIQFCLMGNFTYTQEAFIEAVFHSFVIKEIPVVVRGVRQHGNSKVASNLFRYGFSALLIILRAFRDLKPLRFFTILSFLFFAIGSALIVFLGAHYVNTGQFSPHKWAGFTGAAFGGAGLLIFVLGLMADMQCRIRKNQEYIMASIRNLSRLIHEEKKKRNDNP